MTYTSKQRPVPCGRGFRRYLVANLVAFLVILPGASTSGGSRHVPLDTAALAAVLENLDAPDGTPSAPEPVASRGALDDAKRPHRIATAPRSFSFATDGKAHLFVPRKGRIDRFVVHDGVAAFFGFSADGRHFLYNQSRGGYPTQFLCVSTVPASQDDCAWRAVRAAWSPTTPFVFAAIRHESGDEEYSMVVVDLRHKKETILAVGNLATNVLQWSSDGRRILYRVTPPADTEDLAEDSGEIREADVAKGQNRIAGVGRSARYAENEILVVENAAVRFEKSTSTYLGSPGSEIVHPVELVTSERGSAGVAIVVDDASARYSILVDETGLPELAVRGEVLRVSETGVVYATPDGKGAVETRYLRRSDRQVTALATTANGLTFKAPWRNDTAWTLTQGPNGSLSHVGALAQSLDFQSPGGSGDAVLAPEVGTVVLSKRPQQCNTCDCFGNSGCNPDYDDGSTCSDYRPVGDSCRNVLKPANGNYVVLDHGESGGIRYYSRYLHLEPGTAMEKDRPVCQGLRIGREGHTGCTVGGSCGDHLHYQLHSGSYDSVPIPPESLPFAPVQDGWVVGRKYASTNVEVTTCSNGTAPSTPVLTATPECSGTSPRIRLTWSAAANAETYDVYRNGVLLSGGLVTTQYVHGGVTAGSTYSYFVRAKNGFGTADSPAVSTTAPTNCGLQTPGILSLTATPVCTGSAPSIQLVWTASANATSYDVYRKGAVLSAGLTGTQLNDVGVSPGTEYTYYVRARNGLGSRDSNSTAATAPSCGSIPGSFTLTLTPECDQSTSRVRLSWTAAPNATSYDVYRNGALLFSNLTGTQFLNTSVAAGTAYSYSVKAKNGFGTRDSGTLSATAPICGGMPGTFSLTLTPECNGNTSQVRLNWSAAANAISYDVYRNGILLASGLTGSQFLNTSVTAGTSYSYFVRAKNSLGSRDSGTLSAIAPACGTLPGTFSFTLTPLCSSGSPQMRLDWTASSSASSYDVYRDGVLLAPGLTSNQYLNSGVTTGVSYTYFIRARNGSGAKDSNIQSATAPTCGSIPGSFTMTVTPECSGSTSQIRVTWTSAANATSYDLYRNGVLFSSNVTGNQFINTSVTAGTSYSYYVKARNTYGGRDSGALSATAPTCGPRETIVDDSSGGFTRFGPASYWHEASIGYNSHMWWTKNNQYVVDNYARWQPSLGALGAGSYNIYVYIPSNYSTTANAIYSIRHNGVTDTKVINQSPHFNAWVLLGTYYFSAGGAEWVELIDRTGESPLTKYIGFDAVKWTKQ